MIPELLRNDTSITNVLKFSLHAVTLLSQLDPKDFSHLLLNTSIEESYRGFFKLFGGHHVNLLFSGFQDYFQTLTKEEQVPMFNFMGSVLNTPLYYSAENSSCDASTVDLRQLLEVIPKNYYSRIDPRLTSDLVKMKEAHQVEEQVREEPLVLEGIHQLSQMTQCQIRISYVSNQA